MKKAVRYISDKEAAKLLKVPLFRIWFWVERGALKGRIAKRPVTVKMVDVDLKAAGKGTGTASGYAAAKLLGLNQKTVREQVRRGALAGKIWEKTVWRVKCSVEESAVGKVYVKRCELCGKEFCTPRPTLSRHCSDRHRKAAFYLRTRTSKKPMRPRSYDPKFLEGRRFPRRA